MRPELVDRTYPTSIAGLAGWQKQQGTSREEARRRFVQFVVLASMSSSITLMSRIAFKGGNALRFIHGNPRSTLDLDFSAEADFPDNPDEIKRFIDTALRFGGTPASGQGALSEYSSNAF